MRKLINPRGRIVDVDEKDVPDLLKRGFLHVSSEDEAMPYNQVYDKGPDYKEPYIAPNNTFKRELPSLGDTIEVKIV